MQNFILFSVSALTQIAFCAIIYNASKGDLNSAKRSLRQKFYLLGGTIAFWCLCQYAYDTSLEIAHQQKVLKTAVFATIWVAYFFLIFSRELIHKKISFLQASSEALLALGATALAFLVSFAEISVTDGIVNYQFDSFIYTFLTLVPIVFIIQGVVSLERYAHKARNRDKDESKQARYVSRGMVLTSIFAFSGNYLFSIVALDSTIVANLAVALAPAIFTLTTGYAVFSLKLFNFRKFFFKVVIYGGIFSIAYTLIAVLLGITIAAVLRPSSSYFIAVIFVVALIAYRLSRLLTDMVLNALDANPRKDESRADKNLQEILRKIDTDDVLKNLTKFLRQEFLFDSVLIAINTNRKSQEIKYIALPDKVEDPRKVKDVLKSYFHKDILQNADLTKFSLNGYQFGFAMNRDLLKGVILVGQKTDGRPIYDDEKAALTRIAAQAALALENSLQYYRIQQFNEELEQKINIATKELRTTNEKLKSLDEAKDEFISMASHQLRTPLTSVKGYVSMVLEGDAGKINAQQKELLNQAFTSSQRMVYLIADLLNVSRLQTGKFVIEATPTYLPEVVETEMQQLLESAKAHNLQLTFDKPAEFPTLNLDETKTRQVMMNFMDNAIYYTPSGGHIKVELSKTDKTVEFKVVDDGLGVPKAEQHHLFTKFYRAGNAKKARPDGTGLGLFMAKKVIVAQGGVIIFKSEEGKGSTFGFSLPLAALEVKKTS